MARPATSEVLEQVAATQIRKKKSPGKERLALAALAFFVPVALACTANYNLLLRFVPGTPTPGEYFFRVALVWGACLSFSGWLGAQFVRVLAPQNARKVILATGIATALGCFVWLLLGRYTEWVLHGMDPLNVAVNLGAALLLLLPTLIGLRALPRRE